MSTLFNSMLLCNYSGLFFLSGIKSSPSLNSYIFLLCWDNSQKRDDYQDFSCYHQFPSFNKGILLCEPRGIGKLTIWKAICIQSYLSTCRFQNLSNPVLVTFWWEKNVSSEQPDSGQRGGRGGMMVERRGRE